MGSPSGLRDERPLAALKGCATRGRASFGRLWRIDSQVYAAPRPWGIHTRMRTPSDRSPGYTGNDQMARACAYVYPTGGAQRTPGSRFSTIARMTRGLSSRSPSGLPAASRRAALKGCPRPLAAQPFRAACISLRPGPLHRLPQLKRIIHRQSYSDRSRCARRRKLAERARNHLARRAQM